MNGIKIKIIFFYRIFIINISDMTIKSLIQPCREGEKDPLIQSAKAVVVSLSHDAKQALLKDAMGPGSLPQAPTFKEETP